MIDIQAYKTQKPDTLITVVAAFCVMVSLLMILAGVALFGTIAYYKFGGVFHELLAVLLFGFGFLGFIGSAILSTQA